MKQLFIILTVFLISCNVLKNPNRIDKHKFHQITHKIIVHSHDNKEFDLFFNIQYQIFNKNLSVDSANTLVINSFDNAIDKLFQEHNEYELLDEDTRKHVLDEMMMVIWNFEQDEDYLIIIVDIEDETPR